MGAQHSRAVRRMQVWSHRLARIPQIRRELHDLRTKLKRYELGFPPGHFYSPIPSIEELHARADQLFAQPLPELAGIDLRQDDQLQLLEDMARLYAEQPFTSSKVQDRRYFFDNPNFTYGEGIVLFCVMRLSAPRRIVEIGSGYSSCVMLDTNELFFDNSIRCTFIEPYPELLLELVYERDRRDLDLLEKGLHAVDGTVFGQLQRGDILFVDSTHVSKIGSDVNRIIFDILPSLNPGVLVHFHDIYYPFEYPRDWVEQGRAWNEAYLLRAFLMHNPAYRIEFFNSFMWLFHGR
jgi:hypothetical protein